MHLAHEHLAEIVTCMRRDFRDRLNQERRVLPRFRVWAPLAVSPVCPPAAAGTPAQLAPPVTVWVRDLSRGGIGVMHTRRMEAGQQFVAPLPVFDSLPSELLCQVVYCSGATGDLFSIGTRFVGRWGGGDEGVKG